jgi:hypothetical protein
VEEALEVKTIFDLPTMHSLPEGGNALLYNYAMSSDPKSVKSLEDLENCFVTSENHLLAGKKKNNFLSLKTFEKVKENSR